MGGKQKKVYEKRDILGGYLFHEGEIIFERSVGRKPDVFVLSEARIFVRICSHFINHFPAYIFLREELVIRSGEVFLVSNGYERAVAILRDCALVHFCFVEEIVV